MDIKLLEYIIAIAEEKTLSRAAERVFISQPALSQQLTKLEKELNTPLFIRQNNEMILTDAGRIYINGARAMISIKEKAMKQIADLSNNVTTKISIAVNKQIAKYFYSKILPVFSKKYPNINIAFNEVGSIAAKHQLSANLIDLAIISVTNMDNAILEYIPLFKDELMLITPNSHPLLKDCKSTIQPSDIANEKFILYKPGSRLRAMEDQILSNQQVTPDILCEIDDFEAIEKTVINGYTNSFMPRSLIKSTGEYHYTSIIPAFYYHVVVAYKKSIALSPAAEYLIKLLLEEFKS